MITVKHSFARKKIRPVQIDGLRPLGGRQFVARLAMLMGGLILISIGAPSVMGQATPLGTLKKANWQVTGEVRKAFLAEAEKGVLASLDKPLPADFLKWVRSDAEVYQAVYGSVSPADKRILLNLHQMYSEVGLEFIRKYKHLFIGAAVGRRFTGVGPLKGFHKYTSLLESGLRRDGDYHKNIKAPSGAPKRVRPEVLETAKAMEERALKQTRAYIEQKGITAREVYDEKDHRDAVTALLKANKVRVKNLDDWLGKVLILQGKRPAERDPFPKVSEFFQYLAAHHETPASELNLPKKTKWPMFPIDKTPWPLLVPLSKTLPLREADYIWEKFQGKHGGKNLHVYGPYTHAHKSRGLEPNPEWHLNAWPSRIKQGGLCGTCTSIASGTYTALGKPTFKAGQPGHSCIVFYRRTGKGYFSTGRAQSTSTPNATKTAWLFADATAWRNLNKAEVYLEYHMGLAQAMNLGLDTYMDTRLAVHMYRQMSEAERAAHGQQLLRNAAKLNPYNVEPWYLLGEHHCDTLQDKIDLVALLRMTLEGAVDDAEIWEEEVQRRPDEDLSDEPAVKAQPPGKDRLWYVKTLAEVLIERTFGRKPDSNASREEAIKAAEFLEAQKGLPPLRKMIQAYGLAARGKEAYKAEIEKDFHESLNPTSKKSALGRDFQNKLDVFRAQLPPDEYIAWLEGLFQGFKKSDKLQVKAGAPSYSGSYRFISLNLLAALTKDKRRTRAKEIMAELNTLLNTARSAAGLEPMMQVFTLKSKYKKVPKFTPLDPETGKPVIPGKGKGKGTAPEAKEAADKKKRAADKKKEGADKKKRKKKRL